MSQHSKRHPLPENSVEVKTVIIFRLCSIKIVSAEVKHFPTYSFQLSLVVSFALLSVITTW